MSFQVVFHRAVFRNLAQSQSLSHWPTAWTWLWIFSKLWPKELEATCKLPTWNLAELSSPQGLQIIYCSSWKDSSLIQSMFTEPVSSCNMHMCSVASVVPDSLPPCGLWPARLFCPWDSPGRNARVSSHALLQASFLTQGLSSCLLRLLHGRQILYHWATWAAHVVTYCEYKGKQDSPCFFGTKRILIYQWLPLVIVFLIYSLIHLTLVNTN